MAYLNIQFPTRVSDGSSGGPMYKTHLLQYQSGYESTDRKWPYPRMRYSINANTLTASEIEDMYQFFWVVGGRANSFRFQDPYDYKSCSYASTLGASDQIQLTDLSVTVTSVQLTKTYVVGSHTLVRKITKPTVSTVVFMVDGSTRTTGFTANGSTGIVTFSPALASTIASVRAGFEYDVHCRFDTDQLDITYEGGLIGNSRVPLMEKLEA